MVNLATVMRFRSLVGFRGTPIKFAACPRLRVCGFLLCVHTIDCLAYELIWRPYDSQHLTQAKLGPVLTAAFNLKLPE